MTSRARHRLPLVAALLAFASGVGIGCAWLVGVDKDYVLATTGDSAVSDAVGEEDPSTTLTDGGTGDGPDQDGSANTIVATIYVMGGVTGDANLRYTSQVWASDVDSVGRLSPWRSTTPLPSNRGEHRAVASRDGIYVIGGTTNGTDHADAGTAVLHAAFELDGGGVDGGELGGFTAVPKPLKEGRGFHGGLLIGDEDAGATTLVIGGNPLRTSTEVISLENDLAWRFSATLPLHVSDHAFAKVDRWVYVLGGAGSAVTSATFFAELQRDGGTVASIGTWLSGSRPLPTPLVGLSAVTMGNRIIVLGGQQPGALYVSRYDITTIDGNGGLGPFTNSPPYAIARTHYCALIVGAHLYIIGGNVSGGGATRSVEYVELNPNGTPKERWRDGPNLPDRTARAACVVRPR